jgi:hypothetical protein
MDFIEHIFSISPDGGSGLFEWLLLLIPFLGFTVICRPVRCRDIKNQAFVKSLGCFVRAS